jgi:TonB family protein
LEDTVSTFGFIKYTYLAGVLLFSLLLIFRLVQIGMLFLNNEHIRKGKLIIVKTELDITPFSFFNLLFISKNDENRTGMKEMLAHEMEHVKQRHSIDVIVMELVTILQWYNPFVWLLKRSLRENHEFLADHGALKPGTSSAAYRLLLLHVTLGQQPVLANNFNYSLIKNRIKMITKIKSSKASTLKLTMGVVATMALLTFFACETKQPGAKPVNQPAEKEQVANSLPVQPEEKIFSVVEQMPQYPGGEQALREFIGKSVTYPDDAKKAGIQGKVYVSFVINKEGKVVNAKIIRSANPSLDQEAMRVIGLMPEWKPGMEKGEIVSVQYTLPISFKLQ